MTDASQFTISPLGDSALTLSFGNVIDKQINRRILRLFHEIKSAGLKGVKDVVPAYSALGVHYDVSIVKQMSKNDKTAFEIMSEKITDILKGDIDLNDVLTSRKIKVPVCYAEKFGLDLNDISSEKNISVDEIISLHTGKQYNVYMIGFLPGFAYMGEVDDRISMPRKSQPRQRVEAGYVGIAGKQTGIYPLDSPGGWQIVGKTPIKLFDKENSNPILFQPGDEVEFYSISEDEFTNY